MDNDRYRVNGALRQVMLSARELNSASLPNRTWVNERLTFTHGYGLTLGPVNQVTREGLPVLFVRDLPPVTNEGFTIDQPSLYFGELSNDYVIVRTDTREFHYPRGDDNVFTEYDGRAGLPLGSLWRKLLFALRFGAYQIVLSDDIGPESRILFNRNIGERVRLIAPFLTFDQDPYLVLAGGRLYWIYDAYTTSTRYPYSTRAAGGVNYIRNSVKIVIDAYQGTTTAYLADPGDPIVATYARIFPSLFKPLAEMPAEIRQHVRYPEDIFGVQARVFATYHMTQPAVFYNREDQWETPAIDDAAAIRGRCSPTTRSCGCRANPRRSSSRCCPSRRARRDNLAAWLVARSDGDNYGKLRVFAFPKQKLVFGPRQVVARISQDQTISPQITLWNQQGSQVIWGTLMVIPDRGVADLRAAAVPARVGRPHPRADARDRGLSEPDRDGADARGRARAASSAATAPATARSARRRHAARPDRPAVRPPRAPPPAAPGAAQRLASTPWPAEAQRHYTRAIEAQRAGDWARYGEEITPARRHARAYARSD